MARRIAPMPPQQQRQGVEKREKGPVKAKMIGLLQNGLDKIGTGDTMDAPFSFGEKESDSIDENNTEQKLAKEPISSAGGENASITPTISTEYRADYTDEVKRKYFDLPRKEGYHNIDEGIPSKTITNDSLVPTSYQKSLSSKSGCVNTRSSNDNEIQSGRYETQTKSGRPNTPPLTLYSNEGIPPLTLPSRSRPDIPNNNNGNGNNNILNTDGIAGTLSPGSGMDIDCVGQNTQTSQAETLTPNLNSIPDYTQQAHSLGSAASSRGSMSTATTPLIKQPLLYSAIGSLEHVNFNSLTKLNKRFLTPSKEFCQPKSILIPPARQYQNGQQEQRTSHNSSSSQAERSRQDLETFQEKYQVDASLRPSDINRGTCEKMNDSIRKNDSRNKNPGNSSMPTILPDDKSFTRERSSGRQNIVDNVLTNDFATKTNTNIENMTNSRSSQNKNQRKGKSHQKVSYDATAKIKSTKSKTVEMFRPSSDAYTPRIERKQIKYKAAEARPSVQHMSSHMGTLQRPNFRDALRRVAMIIHQHIVKIESRFEQQGGQYNQNVSRTKRATDDGLFHASMRDTFNENLYRTPTYKCNMARIPMARPGMIYGLRKIKVMYTIPSETEIYDFGHQLFKSVQLSSECSIVCLIYVERLMEIAKVPLLACTWRPIFMCGLLLASKVWQDLSSWNIEFSSVYPQFSLEAINKLELNFLRNVKWDLYISSSSYAKYYFALRSLVEKKDFRQRYNRMVGGVGNVAQSEALKVQERTERVKEEALLQFSRSM